MYDTCLDVTGRLSFPFICVEFSLLRVASCFMAFTCLFVNFVFLFARFVDPYFGPFLITSCIISSDQQISLLEQICSLKTILKSIKIDFPPMRLQKNNHDIFLTLFLT